MGKQLKFLKKLVVLQGTLALGLWLSASVSASVIDAPHNDTNDIKCSDCHVYSLWWKYSPAINSSTPYNQITDGVCNKCHAPGGYAPNKIGHNWESMADIHDGYLGTWSTKCVDCHNPHYQQQLTWLDTQPALNSNLYLATGTINAGSVSPNSTTNTTTLSYKNGDAHLNWINPALWAEKSTPGRGLILVVLDTTQSTFEINAASETTAIVTGTANGTGNITLQGQLPVSYNAADTNFAIIYGQLIKKTIATPNSGNKEVKFFDASITYDDNVIGGAADPVTSPPQGVCQVCHTKTKYYNEDGKQPDRTSQVIPTPRIDATPHNRSVSCIPCHSTSLGFRPTNADHTFISNLGTTCANCHNQADIISGTHLGNCTDCHLTPPELITPFPSSKWPTVSGQSRATGTCYDCHDPIAQNFTAHPKANDHTGQVVAAPNCVGCHFHSNKDVVNDIHGVDGSPCDTCHSLTYNAGNGTYSGSGALLGRAALHGKGDCKNCHTEIAGNFFVHPKSNDHSGQVVATPQCTTACHSGDPVSDTHNWSCGICHTSPTGLLKGSALAHGPGDCMNCHTDFYVHPTTTPHTTEVTPTATCVVCHADTDLINGMHGRLGCATCHDQYGTLQGSAATHTGGGDCTVCHVSQAAGPHPQVNHSAMGTSYVAANPEGNCTDCHTGETVDVVHNGNCLACHVGLSTDLIHTLRGSAAGHEGHATNTCTECHSNIANSFTAHKNTFNHDTQVTALGTNCYTCHTGADPIWNTHKMNCGTCHAEDGRLIGNAAGKGTGKPPTTGNNCSACHTDPRYDVAPPQGALNH